MSGRITITEESLCTNPKCSWGRIGRYSVEPTEWAFAGTPPKPGDLCPDCGGSGIVRRRIGHAEYMAIIRREEEADDLDAGGLFGALGKWLTGGRPRADRDGGGPEAPSFWDLEILKSPTDGKAGGR